MGRKGNIKHILYSVLLLGLIFPLVQKNIQLINDTDLYGDIVYLKKPDYSFSKWFEREYQDSMNVYIEENVGLHNFFVKLYNQKDYSLYKLSNTDRMFVGKDNWLYQHHYIKSALGQDYMGEREIRVKLQKAKELQVFFKQKGIDLLLLYAPGKGTVCRDYIPEYFYKYGTDTTNIETFTRLSEELGLNYIDYNALFKGWDKSEKYPVYPKYGVHWSYYGSYLAADVMIKYLSEEFDYRLKDFELENLRQTNDYIEPDYDLGNLLNIFLEPKDDLLTYADIKYHDKEKEDSINALFIGDSYFWNWQAAGIIDSCFSEYDFWYYGKQIFQGFWATGKMVADIDYKNNILERDVIILISTEGDLGSYGMGFIEEAYAVFIDSSEYSIVNQTPRVKKIIDDLRNGEDLYQMIVEKAKNNNISIERQLILDAKWIIENE